MVDKIVLYTIEKKSKRQIPMVLICRDSAEKNSGVVQVIFGSTKPNAMGRDLLTFLREPIATENYFLQAMDLWLPTKIRHTVFGAMPQAVAWEKAAKVADRFLMRTGRMGRIQISRPSKSRGRPTHYDLGNDDKYAKCSPPIAILITNSNSLEKSLKKTYTSNKENE